VCNFYFFSACTGNPDVVVVVDVSEDNRDLQSTKSFIVSALGTFRQGNPNIRFGLVTYSSDARTIFSLTNDFSQVQRRTMDLTSDRSECDFMSLRGGGPNSVMVLIP
jgi:hypothetical protein